MGDQTMTVRIPVLSREGNFKQWASQVKAMLTVSNRLDEMLMREPAADDAEDISRDVICKAKLQLHVTGPLRDIVERAATAKEAWQVLHDEYMGDLHARKPKLMGDLHSLVQGSLSVIQYIDQARELRDQFEDLQLEASLPLLCHKFIQGLNREVLQTCGPILSNMLRKEGVTLDDICSSLRDMMCFIPGGGEARVHPVKGKETRRCYYCGVAGHLKKDCHKRKRDEASSKSKSNEHQGPTAVLSVIAKIASTRTKSDALWYDSGATHHITHDRSLLRDKRPA